MPTFGAPIVGGNPWPSSLLDLVRLAAWNPPPSERPTLRPLPQELSHEKHPKTKPKNRRQEADESTKNYKAKWCFCFSLYPWHPIPWQPPYLVVSEFLVLNGSLKQFRMFGQVLASKKYCNSWCLKNHLTRFHCFFQVNMDFCSDIFFWNPFVDSWFHLFFTFTPICCEVIQFDSCIFFQNGVGEKNHLQKLTIFCLLVGFST